MSKQHSILSKRQSRKDEILRQPRSTLLPFLATKSNVASTLLLVWTGLKVVRHNRFIIGLHVLIQCQFPGQLRSPEKFPRRICTGKISSPKENLYRQNSSGETFSCKNPLTSELSIRNPTWQTLSPVTILPLPITNSLHETLLFYCWNLVSLPFQCRRDEFVPRLYAAILKKSRRPILTMSPQPLRSRPQDLENRMTFGWQRHK